ncbi:ricin B-like lectin [Dichomitus squalens]|uniref:Ricin B-like lectin n=1 Tax=Dichomitus squalens TaxID=114155 RepID=A0A4Q9MPJ6_9APHY|nr:ricin B-like lectin [Dichomitus squalens]
MADSGVKAGVYFLRNFGTNTVVDLHEATKVQGWRKRELDDEWVSAQLWIITPVKDSESEYTIRNAMSRTYLDLEGGSNKSGTPVVGHEGNKHQIHEQRWKIQPDTETPHTYVIENGQASETYLDLSKGLADDGTPLVGHSGTGTDTDNKNQLWCLDLV